MLLAAMLKWTKGIRMLEVKSQCGMTLAQSPSHAPKALEIAAIYSTNGCMEVMKKDPLQNILIK